MTLGEFDLKIKHLLKLRQRKAAVRFARSNHPTLYGTDTWNLQTAELYVDKIIKEMNNKLGSHNKYGT